MADSGARASALTSWRSNSALATTTAPSAFTVCLQPWATSQRTWALRHLWPVRARSSAGVRSTAASCGLPVVGHAEKPQSPLNAEPLPLRFINYVAQVIAQLVALFWRPPSGVKHLEIAAHIFLADELAPSPNMKNWPRAKRGVALATRRNHQKIAPFSSEEVGTIRIKQRQRWAMVYRIGSLAAINATVLPKRGEFPV